MNKNEKIINFHAAGDIEEFVCAADDCDFDIDVYYNKMMIDAKSILAMLAIGCHKNLVIRYGGCNERFEKVVAKFAGISG